MGNIAQGTEQLMAKRSLQLRFHHFGSRQNVKRNGEVTDFAELMGQYVFCYVQNINKIHGSFPPGGKPAPLRRGLG
jgi:hypothetical protein